MPERIPQDDCFDKAAEFIGERWLEEQVEKFRDADSHKTAPQLVQNYRRARKELGYVEDEFESHFPELSMPTLEFLDLGRCVIQLIESDATVVDPDTFEPMKVTLAEQFRDGLRNSRHYERTLYELRTGYFYDRRGHTVQFLAEDQSDSKTPDILLRTPFKVFVECKRVDALSESIEKAKNIANELNNRTVQHLDPGHAAVYEYSSEPEMSDLTGVIDNLPERVRNGPVSVSLPFGTVTVFNVEKRHEEGVWVVDVGQDALAKHDEVYETYLQPLVKMAVGEDLGVEDVESCFNADLIDTPARTLFVGLNFSCVPSCFERDRVARVAGQVDKARRKFGKEHPNILHIDAPFGAEVAEELVDDIRSEVGGQLASTRRVTAVTVSLHLKQRNESGAEAIRNPAISIKHLDPYSELPRSFDVLGTDIT